MTTLRNAAATTCLLPDHDLPRLTFLDARMVQTCQSKNGQENLICIKLQTDAAQHEARGLTIEVLLWHTVGAARDI
jgi:hypothetical protein